MRVKRMLTSVSLAFTTLLVSHPRNLPLTLSIRKEFKVVFVLKLLMEMQKMEKIILVLIRY